MTYEVQVANWSEKYAGLHGTAHYIGKRDGEDYYGVIFSIPRTEHQHAGQYPAGELLFEWASAPSAYSQRIGA